MASAVLAPLDQVASAVREIALTEKLKLALLEAHAVEMARVGELNFDTTRGLAHMRWRLARVEAAAEILELLTPHETAVRALDPGLQAAGPRAA